jgi:hypothetical protein
MRPLGPRVYQQRTALSEELRVGWGDWMSYEEFPYGNVGSAFV